MIVTFTFEVKIFNLDHQFAVIFLILWPSPHSQFFNFF